MPSVGSTPTTTSPAQQQQQMGQVQYFTNSAQQQQHQQQQQQQQTGGIMIGASQSSSMQHMKLQLQHSLPLQLQYQVTTTQPSSAGICISQTAGIISSSTIATTTLGGLGNGGGSVAISGSGGSSGGISGGDISPVSSSGSFSSADTNKTILNAIINHQNNRQQQQQQQLQQRSQKPQQQQLQHQQQQQMHLANQMHATKVNRNATNTSSLPISADRACTTSANRRTYSTKYNQFMIIRPAVSIDRDYGRSTLKITSNLSNQKNFMTAKTKVFTSANKANNNRKTIIHNDKCIDDHDDDDDDDDDDDNDDGDTIDYDNNDDNIDVDDANDDDPYFSNFSNSNGNGNGNNNIYHNTMRQSSIDSGNSSDSPASFHSNYNPYLHTSRQHLLPKSTPSIFCTFSPLSWDWCTLLCAAMRCFGNENASSGGGNNIASHSNGGDHTLRSHYTNSFIWPIYQRNMHNQSDNQTTGIASNTPHRRLRSYSTASFTPETAFEHFSAPFKHRCKQRRDPLNNITYEL